MNNGGDTLFAKLSAAIKDIEEHPSTQRSLEEYAGLCHMSKYHFLREFKRLKV